MKLGSTELICMALKITAKDEKNGVTEKINQDSDSHHAAKTVQRNLLLRSRATVPPASPRHAFLTKPISPTQHGTETHYASINHCLH